MALIVRAFPLRKPIAEMEAFVAAMEKRRAEAGNFYRQHGVSHDSWHIQETGNGPWIIGITRVDAPEESAPRFARSTAEFDSWFKAQVKHLSGVDQNEQPLGPPTKQVFEWSDDARPNSNICA